MASKAIQRAATDGITSLGPSLDTLPDTCGHLRLSNDRADAPGGLRPRLDENDVHCKDDKRRQALPHPLDDRWIGSNPPGCSLAGKRGRIG
jgi:hypothetical protein